MVNHLYFDVIFTQFKIQKNNGLSRYILNSPFYCCNYKCNFLINTLYSYCTVITDISFFEGKQYIKAQTPDTITITAIT